MLLNSFDFWITMLARRVFGVQKKFHHSSSFVSHFLAWQWTQTQRRRRWDRKGAGISGELKQIHHACTKFRNVFLTGMIRMCRTKQQLKLTEWVLFVCGTMWLTCLFWCCCLLIMLLLLSTRRHSFSMLASRIKFNTINGSFQWHSWNLFVNANERIRCLITIVIE